MIRPAADQERLERLLDAMDRRLDMVAADGPVDPQILAAMRRNLTLTPAQRLEQLTNKMRLRGLARR